MDGSGTLYDSFLQAWAGRSEVAVIAYPPDRVLNYAELTAFVEQRLPTIGPIVLLGESFSGPIAIELAARQPQRVRALVLCCSFCRSPHPQLNALPWSLFPMLKAPAKWMARWVLGRHAKSGLSERISDALKPLAGNVLRSRIQAVMSVDLGKTLSKLSAPILYLQAKDDRLVPRTTATDVCRRAPQTSIARVDGAHFLLQTSPDAAAEAIADFLNC